jgi:hypothetical protein
MCVADFATHILSAVQHFVDFFNFVAFDTVDDQPNEGIADYKNAGEYQNGS